MSIKATIDGNVLQAPSQKNVLVDGETKRVTSLLIISDVWKRDGNTDQLVQDDSKSKLVNVTIWGERLGDTVFNIIRTGMRVAVEGDLYLHEYTEQGKNIHELRCTASDVALKLNRVENIVMRPKQEQKQTEQAQG